MAVRLGGSAVGAQLLGPHGVSAKGTGSKPAKTDKSAPASKGGHCGQLRRPGASVGVGRPAVP